MAMVSTNIKIEPELKQEAQQLFEELGMTLSTAINVFLRQAVREHAIPFRIHDPFYSAQNQAHLQQALAELKAQKVVSHSIEELEAMEDE